MHMFEATDPDQLAAGRPSGNKRQLRDQPLGSRIQGSRPDASHSTDRCPNPTDMPLACE